MTIAVTKFKDVLATDSAGSRGTEYTMKLAKSDPRAAIKGDDIYVKRPGAMLRFTIASSGADAERYFPVGVAFVREGDDNASDEHRLGHLNFPQMHTRLDGCTLLVNDSYREEARKVRHKFSLVIQCGSDGKIGVIDPGIIHEND